MIRTEVPILSALMMKGSGQSTSTKSLRNLTRRQAYRSRPGLGTSETTGMYILNAMVRATHGTFRSELLTRSFLNAGTVTDHDAATQNMHPAMVRTASTGAARAAPAAQSPYKQPLLANSTTMAIQDRPQRSSPAKQPGQMQMQLERGLSAGVIDPEASGPAAGASPAIGSCDTSLFSRFPWKMLPECVSFPIIIAIFNRISSEYSGWKTFGLNHADCCTHMKECPIELPTSTVRLSERELKEAKKTAKAAHENNLFNSVCVAVLLNIRFSKLYPLHAGTNPLPNENNSTGTSGHASGIISRTR